ncbi:eisosome protein SEG2-like isoform X2 [Rhododendron vialii]|uniref:eisosome protein SEG2-like isoform X2 n=1 Tax=Rhododendron vialii TaxID=182163 RepID=UPI00265E4364|nr:eisosome protein SEG2-like isoform X2 [Rhododendron vialii]
MASVKKDEVEEEHREEAEPRRSARLITPSAAKRELEESSGDFKTEPQQHQPEGEKQKKMKSLEGDDVDKKNPTSIKDEKQPDDDDDDHHGDDDGDYEFRKFTSQERSDNNRRVEQSEGFDVGDVPDDIDIWDMPIRPLDILSDSETLKELENYAKLALDKYNKDNKTSFQFAKIVKANYRGSCCGWSGHYITLQAKQMPGSHPMNFQALVKTWRDEEVKLEFCRV